MPSPEPSAVRRSMGLHIPGHWWNSGSIYGKCTRRRSDTSHVSRRPQDLIRLSYDRALARMGHQAYKAADRPNSSTCISFKKEIYAR